MSEVMKLTDEAPTVSIDELPRCEAVNPMGYSEAEIVENIEWKRLLRQRHPTLPDLLLDACIDYYRLKGPDELQKEIDAGLFDKK